VTDATTLRKHLVNLAKVLVFFGIGLGILYLVYQHQDAAWQEQCQLDGVPAEDCSLVGKILDDFKKVNYFWLFMVLLAFIISNVSRTARWLMLVRALGYQPRAINGFLTIMLGYFANLGFPRIGEVIRAGVFARYEGIPAEQVMGTVIVDRIADVLALLAVVGLAFLLQYDVILSFMGQFVQTGTGETARAWYENPLWYILLGGLLLAALAWKFRHRLPLADKFGKLARGFGDGLKTIRQLKSPWAFTLHSINIWLMYYVMTYLGFLAFDPVAHLDPMAALILFVASVFGITIPSPGGMGTYHFLVAGTLTALYGIAGADAFSFAMILFFAVQIGCNVLLGILALIALPIVNK
jgi:uncharacterized membrane protein YbhN (UPF0104 family)